MKSVQMLCPPGVLNAFVMKGTIENVLKEAKVDFSFAVPMVCVRSKRERCTTEATLSYMIWHTH